MDNRLEHLSVVRVFQGHSGLAPFSAKTPTADTKDGETRMQCKYNMRCLNAPQRSSLGAVSGMINSAILYHFFQSINELCECLIAPSSIPIHV